MKISIGFLRGIIKKSLFESALQHQVKKPGGLEMADREQMGKISVQNIEQDELAPHLREPVYSEEECWGPVPPDADPPGVYSDPYTNDLWTRS
jgi:hypothetical protein